LTCSNPDFWVSDKIFFIPGTIALFLLNLLYVFSNSKYFSPFHLEKIKGSGNNEIAGPFGLMNTVTTHEIFIDA
jgi:hypothetical protein